MNTLKKWLFVGLLIGLPPAVGAADTSGFGIIKGTITIGGKPAPDAVVSIEGLSRDQIKTQMLHTKPQKKIIDQRNLKFIPTVVAIMVGETVEFPNNDQTYHNVFSLSKTRPFDLGRYAANRSKSVRFDEPGIVRVFCDIHSHMSAFILVFAHPFFSLTDDEGRYRVGNVPPGTYTVVAWNESLPQESRRVVVPDTGGEVELNFSLGRR